MGTEARRQRGKVQRGKQARQARDGGKEASKRQEHRTRGQGDGGKETEHKRTEGQQGGDRGGNRGAKEQNKAYLQNVLCFWVKAPR